MCYNNHSAKRTSTSSHLHETNVEIEEVIIMLTLKASDKNIGKQKTAQGNQSGKGSI